MPSKKMIECRRFELISYLKAHFAPGMFITIKEICDNVTYISSFSGDGPHLSPFYKFNTNPYIHDKCAVLGEDIRAINWGSVSNNHFIIIRNASGDVKLCESNEEFENFCKKNAIVFKEEN